MDIKQITKNQHYVQRKYLALWTDNLTTDGFANIEIDGAPAKLININRILFEKKFYKIPILNNNEIYVCFAILNGIPQLSKITISNYINNLVTVNNFSKQCTTKERKILDLQLVQLGEDFQKCGEKMMDENIRSKILSCDCSFLGNYEDRYRFIAYLYMQYFRTPKIKKLMASNINNIVKSEHLSNVDGNKVWAVVHGAISSGAASNMAQKQIFIKFLKNKFNAFITCDCPVVRIGLANDNTDRFYYPFSPSIAMIISTDDNDCGVTEINDEEINYYNKLVRNNADRFIVEKCYDRYFNKSN